MAEARIDDTTGAWPTLPYDEWPDTLATLHLWTQVVGKVKLALAPPVNHWWHVTLEVTSRGLTTGALAQGSRSFSIDLDLVEHAVRIVVSDGGEARLALGSRSVAEFYAELMAALESLGLAVRIWPVPVEVAEPVPFAEDRLHATYDAVSATRFFHALRCADAVLRKFRGEFAGKASPVHFFWGSFDLAVTRFSGRPAPVHPGGIPHLADWVTREAYSRELFSAGWWPGNDSHPEPAFYAYAYPEPAGFASAVVQPAPARYHSELREFLLPYEAVRQAPDPEAAVLAFLRSAYQAVAEAGRWDRTLEVERAG